jgi:hypothetical protein
MRYRINKHSARTGLAMFVGPGLVPVGNRAWRRRMISDDVERWELCLVMFIIGPAVAI